MPTKDPTIRPAVNLHPLEHWLQQSPADGPWNALLEVPQEPIMASGEGESKKSEESEEEEKSWSHQAERGSKEETASVAKPDQNEQQDDEFKKDVI